MTMVLLMVMMVVWSLLQPSWKYLLCAQKRHDQRRAVGRGEHKRKGRNKWDDPKDEFSITFSFSLLLLSRLPPVDHSNPCHPIRPVLCLFLFLHLMILSRCPSSSSSSSSPSRSPGSLILHPNFLQCPSLLICGGAGYHRIK